MRGSVVQVKVAAFDLDPWPWYLA